MLYKQYVARNKKKRRGVNIVVALLLYSFIATLC